MPPQKVYKPVSKPKPIPFIPSVRFTPTYYEWLAKNSIQIIKDKVVENTKGTIYEVPEGFILYITSNSLQGMTSVVGTTGDFHFYVNGKKLVTATCKVIGTLFSVERVSNNYPHPIVVNGKEKIEVESVAANLYAWGGFTGFLVKVKDIPAF